MKDAIQALAERVRLNEALPAPVALVLSAATPVVRVGMWLRRLRPRVKVSARVISFGNITAGGAGKTPAVIERARLELAAGRKVAVLTRGYGTKGSRRPVLVDTRRERGALYERIGDEPALIARRVPGVIIARCADRVAAARAAIADYGCDTLILDDGYQYVRLFREENVVCVDAASPFGNGRLLPRGILREPPRALNRATQIILTRCDGCADLEARLAQMRALAPNASIRTTVHAPLHFRQPADGACLPLDCIRGEIVDVACAIARPEDFIATLAGLGAVVAKRHILPDHAPIPKEALESERRVVITEKDAARLENASANVLALSIGLRDYGFAAGAAREGEVGEVGEAEKPQSGPDEGDSVE